MIAVRHDVAVVTPSHDLDADAGDLTLVLIGVVVGYMVITLPSALAVHRLERRVAILR